MNRPGSVICTGSVASVGVTYLNCVINTPLPPTNGKIVRLKGTITAGPGTAIRFKILDPSTGNQIEEYDDPDAPGSPIDVVGGVVELADGPLGYKRLVAQSLNVQVATDDVTNGTTVGVEVEIDYA